MTFDTAPDEHSHSHQLARQIFGDLARTALAVLVIFAMGMGVAFIGGNGSSPSKKSNPIRGSIWPITEWQLRDAAKHGDAHGARVELACFLYRQGFDDHPEARALLESAVTQNNLEAMVQLAKFLHEGIGGPANIVRAEQLLLYVFQTLKAGQYYAADRDASFGPWEFVENAQRDPSPRPWMALKGWLEDNSHCGHALLSWAIERGVDPAAELATFPGEDDKVIPSAPPKLNKPIPPFVPPPDNLPFDYSEKEWKYTPLSASE